MIIFIDLFCGAGGVTTGIERAKRFGKKLAKVIACVNHDALAIKSHAYNHKNVLHFVEDIRKLDLTQLVRLVDYYRRKYPHAAFAIWASLECTNFSKAKGGKPRDADSRTLAEHLDRYINALNPDYVMIENVVEFMSWGPLDEDGKPISKYEGRDFIKWKENIESMGFRYDHRVLNAADYGAYTKRERYFAQFAKGSLPIQWPAATHGKKASGQDMFGLGLQKWKAVKEVLDFEDEGESVFNRWKRIPKVKVNMQGYSYSVLQKYDEKHRTFGPLPDPLSPKTMQRLFMGSVKHIAGGKERFQASCNRQALAFITKWNSNNAKRGGNYGHSVDEPSPVITTQNRLGVAFITKAFSANSNKSVNAGNSVDEPCSTITVQGRLGLAKACFIDKAYSGKPEDKNSSIESPAPAITTIPHESLVQASFIDQRNGGNPYGRSSSTYEPAKTLTTTGGNQQLVQASFISRYNGVNGGKHDNSQSIEGPVGALGTGDNHAKVSAHFIQHYYSQRGQHSSIEMPAATLTTKDRLSKVQADFFLEKRYRGDHNHQSIEEPAGAILTNDKHNLVKAEKWLMNTSFNNVGSDLGDPAPVITADRHHHYLINPSWGGNPGSVDQPCPVVIARQDKAPLYLITCKEVGPVAVPVYEGDCEWTVKLKEFMALYGIADIKMRMLKVPELLRIQGFPKGYYLAGNQADQKKFIGNSVPPPMAQAIITRAADAYIEFIELRLAA